MPELTPRHIQFLGLAEKRISFDRDQGIRELRRRIQQTAEDFNRRGLLNSGMYAEAVIDAYGEELARRIKFACETHIDFAHQVGVRLDEGLVLEVETRLRNLARTEREALTSECHSHLGQVAYSIGPDDLARFESRGLEEAQTHLALVALSHSGGADRPTSSDDATAEVLQASTLRPLNRLFLSHAAADSALAEFVKTELEAHIPSLTVFQTSVPGMIPAGTDWLATIKGELQRADGYLVLLTPRSVTRPWIVFETGAGWMSKRAFATVCAGELDRGSVEMPLSSFQIPSLENPRDAEELFRQLGGALENPESFAARIRDLARESELGGGEWAGVEVNSRYFAWDGPSLHLFPERLPIPTPPPLLRAIRGLGFEPSFGVKATLARHLASGRLQVFETDRRAWRRELLLPEDGDQVLLVHASQ